MSYLVAVPRKPLSRVAALDDVEPAVDVVAGPRRTATAAVSAAAVLVPLLRGGVADVALAARLDLAYVHLEATIDEEDLPRLRRT